MACFTIHITPGLSSEDHARAIELGPTEVEAECDVVTLLERVGFEAVQQVDVTATLLKTCTAFIASRNRHESGLREAEGDEEFEDEQAKQRDYIEAMEAGLLQRWLLIGVRAQS